MDQNVISLLVRRVQPRPLRGFQFLGVISQEQLKGGRLARGTFSRGGFSVSLCAQWAIRAGFQAQTEELVSRVMRGIIKAAWLEDRVPRGPGPAVSFPFAGRTCGAVHCLGCLHSCLEDAVQRALLQRMQMTLKILPQHTLICTCFPASDDYRIWSQIGFFLVCKYSSW